MKNLLAVPFLLLVLVTSAAETWRVSELAFESDGSVGADVDLDAVFTCGDRTLRIPAFWDGGRTYRVRFAPPAAGTWTWRTECVSEKSLDGKSGTLDVKPYAGNLAVYRRGFVRVAAGAKHFEYADGTPFLYLGDTHWGFGREAEDDATNAAAHHVETVAKRRVEQGFTVWQSEPIGCTFDLADGTVDEKDLKGFRIFDRAFQTVADAGLVHANAQFFYPSAMKPPLSADVRALRRLARCWVARYGAYPVMWTLGQEADNDFYHNTNFGQKHWPASENPYVKVAEFIRAFDAYGHPLTAHQENTWETTVTGVGTKAGTNGGQSVFADSNVAARCGHAWWGAQWSPKLNGPQRTEMLLDYWRDPRVAVNYEGRYCGLWTLDFGARAQAWISYLSGFFGYGYGAADLWLFKSTYDMAKPSSNEVEFISLEMKHTPWRKALEFDSAKQMRFFRDYMEGIAWWKLLPDFGTGRLFVPAAATQGAAVAAADGKRLALAYVFDRTSTATGAFTNLVDFTRYRLGRFNPRTGERASLGEVVTDSRGVLRLPPRPDREDWVFSATVVSVADMPDAVPGLEVEAEIVFDAVPKNGITFLGNEAWALTYQPWHGKGSFAFQVGNKWYNTALAEQPVEPGRTYRVRGGWDGAVVRVAVEGGKEGRQIRRDPMPPVREPTVMKPFAGKVRKYSAKIRRESIVHLFDLKSKELLPRAGKPFTLTGEAFSGGTPVTGAVIVATVKTPGATISPNHIPMGTGPCEWKVDAGTNGIVAVEFRIEADGKTLCSETKDVVVMPAEDPDFSAAKWNPPVKPTKTFHVDSEGGDDAADGLTPKTAWKTLGRVRGRVLGPGERLLLKRGSVFDEELQVGARGAPDNWASVGAYGTGARPTIRRDRMFDQRCMLVTGASYFAVRDLIVCNAGKGLCIENRTGIGGHVLVENCLAHHIEGSYRWNAHGIPEWRDLSAPKEGGIGAIALTGMRHLVFRDCETYQNSWGFHVTGDDVWLGRIYTHDNASHNTSPHPMIVDTRRAWYVDSVLDASGWNASAGTMGIMLCVNRGFVIRGVHFLNMPDSASHDEGGVDFESGGEGILVDRCTFRRNAGAAIEVLGLYTPQAKNLHFRECRFDRNNWANKLGPSEIFVYGAQEKSIDCSCGLVEKCGYVLEPGIAFYTNQSCHSSKAWRLRDNREWPSAEQLDRAMPWGDPPAVTAGPEIWTTARTVTLAGETAKGALRKRWETREGPGEVRFARPSDPKTDATFPCEGDWRLALAADNRQLWRTARTAVHVLPAGAVTVRAWTFAKNHDLEGWTHWNLGTTREVFKGSSSFWDTFSNPVHDVVGDYYVVAVRDATDAYLLSPDDLHLSDSAVDRVRLRMQNRTNAAKMRLSYVTTEDAAWDDRKSVEFTVKPQDRDDTVYEIPLAFTGRLARLRLAFANGGEPVAGTLRIDYLWLGRLSSGGRM